MENGNNTGRLSPKSNAPKSSHTANLLVGDIRKTLMRDSDRTISVLIQYKGFSLNSAVSQLRNGRRLSVGIRSLANQVGGVKPHLALQTFSPKRLEGQHSVVLIISPW